MTVATQTPYAQATGNGVATNFPFQYLVLVKTDQSVYVDGVLKTVDVDYTIAGLGASAGGSITFAVAPVNGAIVTQVRTMLRNRTIDYQQLGDFLTPVVNPDFDRAILLIQDMGAQLGRAIITPPSEVATLPTLPSKTARAGKYIAFDATGQPIASAGTGNDSALRTDLATTTSGGDGSRLIGYRRSETGSVARSVFEILRRFIFVEDFGTNTVPGTTDMTAPILAACAAAVLLGGGTVFFPAGRVRTTAEITRPIKVSFQGMGRKTTTLEGAHNGKMVSCISAQVPPNLDDDQNAFIDGIGFAPAVGFTPSHAIYYQNIGFTWLRNLRYEAGIVVGEEFRYVLNSRFENVNNAADTGTKLVSSSVTDGTNLCKFVEYAWASNATCALNINGHGCYQNSFDTCSFFNAALTSIDITYAAKTLFTNCTWEGNPVGSVKLRGGDGFIFKNMAQVQVFQFIDLATFGARNVMIESPLGWSALGGSGSTWALHDEITVRDPTYTLDEVSGLGITDEAHYLTDGHSTTGRQFANFPGYAGSSAFSADSHITPLGGDIPAGSYNRIGSWNFSDGAQWSTVGTAGAADPFGGTTAYNMNNIANSTHGGFGTGAAHTGRTFTFQVWASFVGRVRLGIGSTNLGIVKRANFYSTNARPRLLAVTYTSGVDVGTTPFMSILTAQNTIMWRPCHYESFGPLPALQPNRSLIGVVGPIRVEDTRITVFGDVTPVAGAFTIGDTVEKITPVVGQPKRWRVTVAGTGAGATYTSEGNL